MEITNTAEYKALADELASFGYASSDLTFEVLDAMHIALAHYCAGVAWDDPEPFKRKLRYHLKQCSPHG